MDNKAVYVFKAPAEYGIEGLALDVHLHTDEDGLVSLRFDDTVRGHEQYGTVKEETSDGFTFECTEGLEGTWEFKCLSLAMFRQKYFKYATNGDIIAKTMHSTADLWEWYRRNFL